MVEEPEGRFAFQVGRVSLPVMEPENGLLAALKTLAGDGATEKELIHEADSADGFPAVLKLHYYLDELFQQGWLSHAMYREGAPFATCVPIQRDHRFEGPPIDPAALYQSSRFACCRRSGSELILESPLARAHVVLHDWRAAALWAQLAAARRAADFGADIPGAGGETARMFLELLLNAGFLNPEDAAPGLAQWEFHDLYFHSRSREGRHANPYGATNRFRGIADRPPAVKPPMSEDAIPLYRPDLGQLLETDVSLTRALEERRSRRTHAPESITARELGEFLYRAARAIEIIPMADSEVSRRVYPGGGAAYELEIYAAVNQCRGLDSGFYQYRPLEHELCKLSGRTSDVEWLLENAGFTASCPPPQVLFQIAARFQRVSWRYSSVAYATILKDVGVLYQTMYLVAEAMGLAACALGGGHSDMFARTAGTNYYEETSVGEFMLGRREE